MGSAVESLSLRRNVLANLFSRGLSIGLGLLVPPLVAKAIGIEAFGVIGLYGTVAAVMAIFDIGFSTAVTRELARLSALPDTEGQRQDVARTFEVMFWAVGAVVGAALISLVPVLSQRWVSLALTRDEITSALRVAAVAVVALFPQPIYAGVLNGLQRQTRFAAITASTAVVRSVGALVLVHWVSNGLQAYFLWQLGVTAVSTAVLAMSARRLVAVPGHRARFRFDVLRGQASFVIQTWLTNALGVVLSQSDKLIVAAVLPLSVVGSYTLAGTASNLLYSFITPVFTAVFPMLTQAAVGDRSTLALSYGRAIRLLGGVVAPPALVLATFSHEVAWVWTNDVDLASRMAMPLSVLAVAALLHGFMHLPYALSLASGTLRVGVIQNLVGVAVVLPLQWWWCSLWGAPGAALGWLALTTGYVMISAPIVHWACGLAVQRVWFVEMARATAPVAAVVTLAQLVLPAPMSWGRVATATQLVLVGVVALLVTWLTNDELRQLIVRRAGVGLAVATGGPSNVS